MNARRVHPGWGRMVTLEVAWITWGAERKISQLIPYISNSEGQVNGFVEELTCAKQLLKHFMSVNLGRG